MRDAEGDNLTSFAEFRRLRAERQVEVMASEDAERARKAAGIFGELAALVEMTVELADTLESGIKHHLAKRIRDEEEGSAEELAHLIRRYERASWRLHGEMRHLVDQVRRQR